MTLTPEQMIALGRRFRMLHERSKPFVIPNPWDVGSARILALAGFEALASTSAGYAASLGVADARVDSRVALRHIAELAAATELPLSADLENGYDDSPAAAAAAIGNAAAAGAVGGSIEDRDRHDQRYDLALAVARVQAAVETARALPFDFIVTARCENFLIGHPDLNNTIARLQAFQEVGADCLYAPGLDSPEQIRAVTSSVDRPINVVMGLGRGSFTVEQLGDLGVRRISVGSAMARAAYGALLRAADEISTAGTFTFASDAVPYARLHAMLSPFDPVNVIATPPNS